MNRSGCFMAPSYKTRNHRAAAFVTAASCQRASPPLPPDVPLSRLDGSRNIPVSSARKMADLAKETYGRTALSQDGFSAWTPTSGDVAPFTPASPGSDGRQQEIRTQ